MKRKHLTFITVSLALLSAGAMPAAAGHRANANNPDWSVTACSRYGNGCYTAGLRSGREGKQLVLRHGTRIDCDRDCRGTLREATVDFWDTMRENGG
ncbi:hypothetical protein [Hyphomicrobium facile]|uniref:Uncharacterized protein n=1 Tax=Hyphomicrobium facile TaxID=51670 RepID=A0A1I7MTV5_9HYPH|nr:hypothetical protein [Hyphomicrobium facile]SFV25821.1 hypothetical protein SAMN04488557_0165 [Hyphomicrobium facile]